MKPISRNNKIFILGIGTTIMAVAIEAAIILPFGEEYLIKTIAPILGLILYGFFAYFAKGTYKETAGNFRLQRSVLIAAYIVVAAAIAMIFVATSTNLIDLCGCGSANKYLPAPQELLRSYTIFSAMGTGMVISIICWLFMKK